MLLSLISMVERGGGAALLGERTAEAVEVGDAVSEVVEQKVGEIHREAVAYDDALHGVIGEVVRHRIRGDEPAPLT